MAQLEFLAKPRKQERRRKSRAKLPASSQNPTKRSRVAHRTRPPHRRREPVLVTLRMRDGLPNLRSEAVLAMLRRIIADPRMPEFQAVHYSIQSNHVHLIVEAEDKAKLSSGLRSLIIRIALRLNALLERKGRVFADRYHRDDLPNPSRVRNVLRYVLMNFKKHGVVPRALPALDAFSSALAFDGWSGFEEVFAAMPAPVIAYIRPRAPRTWLLSDGWRHYGALDISDAPAESARQLQ